MSIATLPRARRTNRPLPRWRLWRRALTVMLLALMLLPLLLRLYTIAVYQGAITDNLGETTGRTAIVFGAGVLPNGEPTDVLADRVSAAAELYRRGAVQRIILTGDGRPESTREPAVMRRAMLRQGVPDSALILDDGGLRTRESCQRARAVFGVTRAVLITQRFHLPRALLLCENAGLDVVGHAGAGKAYPWRWRVSWQARETAATTAAWWDVAVAARAPSIIPFSR